MEFFFPAGYVGLKREWRNCHSHFFGERGSLLGTLAKVVSELVDNVDGMGTGIRRVDHC